MSSGRNGGFQSGSTIDTIAPALLVIGGLCALLGLLYAFTIAPLTNGASIDGVEVINGVVVSNMLLLSQKIFYWHMPVAIVSFIAIVVAAFFSLRFLMKKETGYDMRAKLAMEIGLIFILCTMVTGLLWTRFEWGVWWTWEPRLTTYFILMLLVVAYFILRNAVLDPQRKATYASVFGILIFADVPICFMVTRLIPSSVHPVVFRADAPMSADLLIPLLLSVVGFVLVALALFRLRLRSEVLEERLGRLQDVLED